VTSIERPDGDRSLPAAVPETQDSVPAPSEPAGVTQRRGPRLRTWLAAIAAVLVLPIVVAAVITYAAAAPAGGSADRAANAAAARVVSAADLEQEYGIKVNLVAVTATGGLVDLRFMVIDKDKAAHVFHDAATMPELFVENSGAVLSTRKGMQHALTLADGARYFILYSNPGGVVQAGTQVSVVIGDVRLAPFGAQS
jgi:hypothetical protein